ncbi:MAG: N-acyl homoserine lactonase family protein [Cytophagales bacterium]|nr:N-acyl homoserine lactonase family protein [Rhizobacter sp.]
MKLTPISWALCAGTVISLSACAQTAPTATPAASPEVTVTRLECGTGITNDVGRFSDTFSMEGVKIPFVFSCYLIKHGNDYMLWDTGHAMTAGAVAPKVSVVDQLAQLQLKPEQIKFVGISHYHADHTGQVASFPQATLLIGTGDWNVVTSPKPVGANPAFFAPWISGGSKVETVPLDKDVFGDGSVVMLTTPGHTPGHHSVLIRLKEKGNVLITGDLAHFHENYEANGVPGFNTSRAETLASLDRFKKLAAQLKATVILQHDARDVGKLPAFPMAAK